MKSDMDKFCSAQQGVTYTHNGTCKREDLHSRPQRRFGVLLSTSRQARAACGSVGPRMASASINSRGGEFPPLLSHETASCDNSAGTWLARLWAMLAVGHARKHPSHRPTRQRKRQSFACCSPSMPTTPVAPVDVMPRQHAIRATLRLQHAEDCGFLCLFHFRSGLLETCCRAKGKLQLLLGGLLCFLLFLFVLIPFSTIPLGECFNSVRSTT